MVSIGKGPFGSYPGNGEIHGHLSQKSQINRTVDFDVFENVHKDNTIFWGNNGWLGNLGSAEGWVSWFSRNDFTWKVRDRDVKVYGNTAVVATIATSTTTKDGSETKVTQVRETNVLSKINNKWVLVHTHSSKFEPKNDD